MASFSSSFTGADGDNLTTLGFTDGSNMRIIGNRAGAISTATFNWYRALAAATVDQDISALFNVTNSAQTTPFIAGRMTATGDCYLAVFSAGTWFITKRVGGTFTDVGSYAGDVPTASPTVVLKLRAGSQELWINGTLRISSTDTDAGLAAAGSFGIGAYYADTATGVWLDDYLAQDAGATAPTIDTDPASRAGNAGGTATFSWVASSHGGTGLSTQCQRNISGTWTDVGSAQGANGSYTTGTLAAGDDGAQFRVTATDSVGSDTSATATLTVILTWPTLSALGELAFGEVEGEAPASGGSTTLTIHDMSSASSADAQTLVVGSVLAVADASSASSADNLTLGTDVALVVSDASSASSADNATLSIGLTLTVQDSASATTSDNLALSTDTTLQAQDMSLATSADNMTLGVTGETSLAIADAASSSSMDAANLTVGAVLEVQDALSAMTADNVTLSFDLLLAIQDALSATTADGQVLVVGSVLSVDDATVAVAMDGVVLWTGTTLTVQDADAATSADNVTLDVSGQANLSIQDLASATSADNLDLVVGVVLQVGDAASATSADNLVLQVVASSTLSEAAMDAIVSAILAAPLPVGGAPTISYGATGITQADLDMLAYKLMTRVVP